MTALRSVLTGDLIASTKAGSRATDRAMQVLAETATKIAHWPLTENLVLGDTHFTRFRGDGWQMIVSAAAIGLRAALMMYARLMASADLPATRIAVGTATVDQIPGADLSDASGAAFAVSGRALGRMERGERLRLAGAGITPCRASLIALLNDRIADWTAEQAEAIALVIQPDAPTQATIAAGLGISPQALSYRLSGARWPTLKRVLAEWEQSRPEEAQ